MVEQAPPPPSTVWYRLYLRADLKVAGSGNVNQAFIVSREDAVRTLEDVRWGRVVTFTDREGKTWAGSAGYWLAGNIGRHA